MLPNFRNGQIVFIDKKSDGINFNDVIAFQHDEELLIKRVIGVRGDRIEIRDGTIYRNEVKLLAYRASPQTTVCILLGEGQYFVIGDNFQSSTDSRDFGPIDNLSVVGKAF